MLELESPRVLTLGQGKWRLTALLMHRDKGHWKSLALWKEVVKSFAQPWASSDSRARAMLSPVTLLRALGCAFPPAPNLSLECMSIQPCSQLSCRAPGWHSRGGEMPLS